ncbi:PREDICTED: uncharacterized protein LOC108761579 [Trachymyrmex cornetzi]|uniref:Myb/SANT-like DNA-binding domain-containing protein n=1 Tax=Trachymyrmex cornetzi TaxID=471704 RepID=A0A151J773_9HYME|nr:PREDICTED: uncharacterized protein LOC108761579 [Trachymyrmex cornetzi]KYN19397.1 hypothetical protein ALC57_08280 [Trachymyrmex cornetzi]
MAKKGYTISGKKCCTKFQTLKRTYKQIKDHNNKSGNSRKTWEYFDAMDAFCGTKPWVEPTAVAGSNINNAFDDDDNDGFSEIPKKKIKSSAATYKQKILEYRQLRSEKKDAQHAEKMELLKDIKNLLQHTIEKDE